MKPAYMRKYFYINSIAQEAKGGARGLNATQVAGPKCMSSCSIAMAWPKA